MYLCAEVYHISHSEFLGWDEGDRQKAFAHELRKRMTCPQCGTRHDEWQGARKYTPFIDSCIGCREVARAEKNIPSGSKEYSRIALRLTNEG